LQNISDYELIFTKKSEDYLKKLDKRLLQMILECLENIRSDPLSLDTLKGN
jgi:mRNA-degrading endonuclease RelE of RelBE toxin-antitoxin system